MMDSIDSIHYRIFKNRDQFRRWLDKNHAKVAELWLGFYKKGVAKVSVSNSDAVEVALCYGWINGKVRKLDDEIYLQRFTPRHDKSVWSEINKKRVQQLTKQGLMTEAGLEKVRIAKQNGSWCSVELDINIFQLPADIEAALKKNKPAYANFKRFTENQQYRYLWWVESAKQVLTRHKRIEELVERAEKNIKPGLPLIKD